MKEDSPKSQHEEAEQLLSPANLANKGTANFNILVGVGGNVLELQKKTLRKNR